MWIKNKQYKLESFCVVWQSITLFILLGIR